MKSKPADRLVNVITLNNTLMASDISLIERPFMLVRRRLFTLRAQLQAGSRLRDGPKSNY
jgi:hypothetical protein